MSTEKPEHISRSYEEQLRKLRDMVARMGGIAERQVNDATQALVRRDAAMGAEVAMRDAQLDALEHEIEAFCIRILATRQPMAGDLRFIIAAMKVSHDLERIGDYARNGAKRSVVLAQQPTLGSLNGFQRMSILVQENLKLAIDALANDDADAAQRVWLSDEQIDNVYNGIFREMLTHMMEDPRNITAAIHLLFIAKNLERIGDHATNIAETVHYAVRGDSLPDDRPKADASAYAVVRPPE
jgi:phosphate transport system protein